jgi:hypothetical protein
MNTGQTMLTIAALAMLSVLTMNYYRSIGYTGRTLSKTNAAFTATTVATSFLERVESCDFDAISDTITTPFTDSTRFTKPDHLGKDGTENVAHYEDYDDIDDFDRDTIVYTPGWMNERYTAYFRVYYVNSWNGDVETPITNRPTFLKRVDVKAWRSFPPSDTTESIDTIKMFSLHGYYIMTPI